MSSDPVSLINPQILLRDVVLKQSGVKAKQNEEPNQKLSHWKPSLRLVTGGEAMRSHRRMMLPKHQIVTSLLISTGTLN